MPLQFYEGRALIFLNKQSTSVYISRTIYSQFAYSPPDRPHDLPGVFDQKQSMYSHQSILVYLTFPAALPIMGILEFFSKRV
jgi:hypothetical protein